jgi:hypothetical protein
MGKPLRGRWRGRNQLHINKAKGAFAPLRPLWRSKEISRNTKLRIFNTNVKSVLLYGCETWEITQTISHKLQSFVNTCLPIIINSRWPEVISNHDLWEKTKQKPISTEIQKRKWKWIGHILTKPPSDISRAALEWNPQGTRKRERPRTRWRRTMLNVLKPEKKSWAEVKGLTANRTRWRIFTRALCSTEE